MRHLSPGLLSCLAVMAAAAGARADDRVTVGPATFVPVLAPAPDQPRVHAGAFRLDRRPVTNAQFLQFVLSRPQWRRDQVARPFADQDYLSHWAAADRLGEGVLAQQPVTRVSWFAARAYCTSAGGRLPNWYEWELAAAADESVADARSSAAWRNRILSWYSHPGSDPLALVGQASPNVYGVQDLDGLIWEWVEDFGAVMTRGNGHTQGDSDKFAPCGAGALSAQDPENYPILMRIAFLSSLEGRSTVRSLGFRCAAEAAPRKR